MPDGKIQSVTAHTLNKETPKLQFRSAWAPKDSGISPQQHGTKTVDSASPRYSILGGRRKCVNLYFRKKAPNGENSNLSSVLWEACRTNPFNTFFGDWRNSPETASKVVDANGEPLVVYHGTNQKFSIFEQSKLGALTGAASAKQGFFFVDSKAVATGYAQGAVEDNGMNELLQQQEKAERRGDWTEVDRLTVEIEALDSANNESQEVIYSVFLGIKSPLVIDAKGKHYKDVEGSLIQKIKQAASSAKYDGVIIENLKDAYVSEGDKEASATHYVVFEPNQIKSTNNRGGYDALNPDINFSLGGMRALTASNALSKGLTFEDPSDSRGNSTLPIFHRCCFQGAAYADYF